MNNQNQANIDTIKALKKNGSNMSKSHSIEHHFVSKNKKNIESLSKIATDNNYKISKILSTGLIFKTYFFDIIIETIPSIANITNGTNEMIKLSDEYGCDYDGWGCPIVE